MNPAVQSSVSPSLRALFSGSVDYAGLFPPASLSLEPALENQAAYSRGNDAWMLGHFVLPAAKLSEAGLLLARKFDFFQPLKVSALGPKANSADEFLENLRISLHEVVNFGKTHGKESGGSQFEAPLPRITSVHELCALFGQAAETIKEVLPRQWALQAFWEVSLTDDLPMVLRGFAEYNRQVLRTSHCRAFALKLRTGGTEAAAFPTPQQLALALIAARDAGVKVKFTAGLHHPIRRFDETIGTYMHGFLNVFAVGVLAREHRLDAGEATTILEDESPENFRFDAEGFSWRNRRVSTEALAEHRRFIASFGSCSFDEPRDDLRRLGLML